MMNLELLPDELFLDLFDYLNGINLLYAFFGLNSRLNFLLYKQFRSYRFQFNSVSKRHFDMICQEHLPFIANRVISLRLSDNYETPEQVNLFFSYIPSFHPFTHLRSLMLSSLHSYEILLKLLDQCQYLGNLTGLKFYLCFLSNPSADFQFIIDKIWSLPKLTTCDLGISIKDKPDFFIPSIISSSLTRVSIPKNKLKWSQMRLLFDYTPHLKHLSTSIKSSIHDDYLRFSLSTLTKLNLHYHGEFILQKLNTIFQNMPDLRHLDMTIWSELINGYQWEEIINNHLHKLQTFRLHMLKSFFFEQNIQERVDELIDSFRSPFWIAKHQWFVRCLTWEKFIHLFTLSKKPEYYFSIFPDTWQSTYPNDNYQSYYDEVNSIYNEIFPDKLISFDIRLPNINTLRIKIPIDDQFGSIVPNLNRLYSLTVSFHTESFQYQLQCLLDQAPHLHTLQINQDTSLLLKGSLLNYITNTSVRKLDLENYNHDFNEEECIEFTRSPLVVQCEVLSIRVKNCQSILHLVKNLINLRTLRIYWNDGCFELAKNTAEYYDQIVQWLKNHLPSNYLIINDRHYGPKNIIIWI